MLVLTRKHQEKIRIGDHITITVLKTKGKAVRLGIEAPAEVPVIRGELSFEGQIVLEGKTVEWSADDEEVESLPRRKANEVSHVDRVQKHWAAGSKSADVAPQVSLQRVSREQLKKLLPKAEPGLAPLRALMERRSVSA
ncbi:MAG: carbon storage regulator [Pirellulales bacterium]